METNALPLPEPTPDALSGVLDLIHLGGPAMWAIAALSVASLTLILWKVMRLAAMGAWSGGGHTARALALWKQGKTAEALSVLDRRHSVRAILTRTAMRAALEPGLDRDRAEAETARVARGLLAQAGWGLRGLELAVAVGPLLGLLGTVTGMISSFQSLQAAGVRADTATLAGGIWEALLTTAAGMAVAIPAQIALVWFESIVDRLRHDMEDAATQVLMSPQAASALRQAAE
ncbi:MAG: flagellar motor protein MotA [Rhodobacteraceae bacterium PARR1]|nr:MAG: flagellar motor protein MotA [Rhodobacteraceae bacterium PARR1]